MPNIHIRIPKGSYPGAARADLVRRINDAAANAEQIPAEPRKRMLCWVLIKYYLRAGVYSQIYKVFLVVPKKYSALF